MLLRMSEYTEKKEEVVSAERTIVLRSRVSEEGSETERILEPSPVVIRTRDHVLAGLLACCITGGVAVASVVYGTDAERVVQISPEVTQVYKVEAPIPPTVANPYEAVSVGAESYVVYDVHAKRVLASKNADTVRPLASLTKVMTALVALESGYASPVTVSPYALETEGDSGLAENEQWRLQDLVSFTLLTSSNDGADAIAAAVGSLWQSTPETLPEYERVDAFVDRMNVRARELELSQTFFRNASGLDTYNGEEGGAGTAEDMAKLLAYVWQEHGSILDDTADVARQYVSEDGVTHVAHNTNEHVSAMYGVLGSKTGYTDLAGGNLTLMYDSGLNHPVVIVVLGSTRDGRFKDVEKLVAATYGYIESGWYAYDVAGSTDPRL